MRGCGLCETVHNIHNKIDALGIMQLRTPNTSPNPTPMRHTDAQLTTVYRYVPITNDITLQELSGITFMEDSAAKRQCPDN